MEEGGASPSLGWTAYVNKTWHDLKLEYKRNTENKEKCTQAKYYKQKDKLSDVPNISVKQAFHFQLTRKIHFLFSVKACERQCILLAGIALRILAEKVKEETSTLRVNYRGLICYFFPSFQGGNQIRPKMVCERV